MGVAHAQSPISPAVRVCSNVRGCMLAQVQDAAVAAFREMCHGLYTLQHHSPAHADGVVDHAHADGVVDHAHADHLVALASTTLSAYLRHLSADACPARSRRGYAAALGCLPEFLLTGDGILLTDGGVDRGRGRFREVVAVLQQACVLPATVHLLETEARRQALRSLYRRCHCSTTTVSAACLCGHGAVQDRTFSVRVGSFFACIVRV